MQQHNENSENRKKKIINVLQIKTNVYDFTSPFYFKYIFFLNVKKIKLKRRESNFGNNSLSLKLLAKIKSVILHFLLVKYYFLLIFCFIISIFSLSLFKSFFLWTFCWNVWRTETTILMIMIFNNDKFTQKTQDVL